MDQKLPEKEPITVNLVQKQNVVWCRVLKK